MKILRSKDERKREEETWLVGPRRTRGRKGGVSGEKASASL